jgi:hypothetical protein
VRERWRSSRRTRGGAASARVAGGGFEISPGSVPNGEDSDCEKFDMDLGGGGSDLDDCEVMLSRAQPRPREPSPRERTSADYELRQAVDGGSTGVMRSTEPATAGDMRHTSGRSETGV